MSGKSKKNDGRGAKVGVPHITNKVIAMDEAGRESWLAKCPAEFRDEVRARLTDVLANGRVKGKSVDYASLFNGKSYDELQTAEKFLQTAKEDAKREEFKRLQGEADAIRERLESLKA
jgi:hypothetical protein